RDPPADWRSDPNAALFDAALSPYHSGHAPPLRLDRRGGGGAGRSPAAQASVPERPLLPRARGDLFHRLESAHLLPEQVVTRARRGRRSPSRPAHAAAERRRPGGVRPDDHVRVVRLADVPRAALVLNYLWGSDHGRTGAFRNGISDRCPGLAQPTAAAQ